MNVQKGLEFIKKVKDYKDIPIGLLMYYNLIYQYGIEKFFSDFHQAGVNSILVADLSVDDADEIKPEWLDGATALGITAGASAPEVLVEGVIERCKALTSATVSDLTGPKENVTFALPKELR